MLKKLSFLITPILLASCIGETETDSDNNSSNQVPQAVINVEAQTITAGNSLTFSAANSSDSDGGIVAYKWEVNGEEVGTNSATLIHDFDTAGKYFVTLTVTDNSGAVKTTVTEITVNAAIQNAAPTAVINSDQNIVFVGDTQTYTSTGSNDIDGDIVSFQWEVNGQIVVLNNPELTYQFSESSEYDLKLTVTDNKGAQGFATTIVSVNALNNSPVARLTSTSSSSLVNENVTFDASTSSDVEDGLSLSYEWKIDGQLNSNTVSSLTTSFATAGTHEVEVIVTDSQGATSTLTETIEINDPSNNAPTASLVSTGISGLVEGDEVTFTATATDLDNDPLTYQWFINSVEQNNATKTLTYQFDQSAMYEVEFVVKDDSLASATASINFEVMEQNVAPIAVLTGPSNGDAADTFSFDASTSTDANLDTLTYKWFVDGVEQSMQTSSVLDVVLAQGKFVIKVEVSDQEYSSEQTHTIVVNGVASNTDPVAMLSAQASANINDNVIFDASASFDSDVNDSITFEWAIDGNVSLTDFNSTLTTAFSDAGDHTVSVKVTDLLGNTNTKTITINIVDTQEQVAPVAVIVLPSGDINAKVLITLDGSNSTDGNDDIVLYEWFVDTQKIGEGEILEYRFDSQASKTLSLHVTDSQNQSDQTDLTVDVLAEIAVDPVAVITVDGVSITQDIYVTPGTSMTFSLGDSFDPNENSGLGDKYWVFDSNQAQRVNDYTITFDQVGSFDLSLTVFDYSNAQGTTQITIHVAYENVLPQINIVGLSDVYDINKDLIVADASSTTDPDSADSGLTFEWKYNSVVVSTSPVLTYQFTQEGNYTFELTVKDNRDGVVTTSIDVSAQDIPETAPVAVINISNVSGYAPFTTQFNAMNSTDANGNHTITSYSWKVDGQEISTSAQAQYTFDATADYQLSLVVTDETNLSSTEVTTIVSVEALDPNHPEVFTLLEDTGKMKIYKINNCGVSPEIIANSGAILVDASGTSVTTAGWNHIPTASNYFANITSGDYSMSAGMNGTATNCESVPTNHNTFVKRYTDWHKQHANGQDYALNGVRFNEIQTFVVDLYLRSDRTEYLTPTQLSDIYGPDSTLQFPLTQAEVEDMDIGHLNLGFEISKGDGPGAKVALVNISVDPEYMDQWLRIEMDVDDMWVFEKDANYVPQDRTVADFGTESPQIVKITAETESTDVYRNYRQSELHAAHNITDAGDLPNTYPKHFKIIEVEIKRMEIIVTP